MWRMPVLPDAINKIDVGGLGEFGEYCCCHSELGDFGRVLQHPKPL